MSCYYASDKGLPFGYDCRKSDEIEYFVTCSSGKSLPPYSPNLNLIERLWKFVKKECLYSKYYSNFGDLKNAIINCLSQTESTHKKKLDSLLTLRFQRFEKAQFLKV